MSLVASVFGGVEEFQRGWEDELALKKRGDADVKAQARPRLGEEKPDRL